MIRPSCLFRVSQGRSAGYVGPGGSIRDPLTGRSVQLHAANRAVFGNGEQQRLALESAFFLTQQGTSWGGIQTRLKPADLLAACPLL